jgi:hypothetical protein
VYEFGCLRLMSLVVFFLRIDTDSIP